MQKMDENQDKAAFGQEGVKVSAIVEKKGFKRAEAAIYLGVTTVTIDRLAKRGLLRPSRALRHPIYSREDLDRFLHDTQ